MKLSYIVLAPTFFINIVALSRATVTDYRDSHYLVTHHLFLDSYVSYHHISHYCITPVFDVYLSIVSITYFYYLSPTEWRCLRWLLWIIVVIFLPPTSCIYRDFRATFTIKSLVQYPHCKAYSYTYTIALILLLGKIIPSYSYCKEKKLVYIAITTPLSA